MERGKDVDSFFRWWDTLGRPERLVAMSLATGGTIAIVNSTVWAAAVCYMTRQRTRARVLTSRGKSLLQDRDADVTRSTIQAEATHPVANSVSPIRERA